MAKTRPNILWLCTDSQRHDTIGALGHEHVSTPNIDKLVHKGVAFDTCYAQSPVCTPSRSSFLTGVYPSTIHANGNGNPRFLSPYPLVTKTLASAGYECGLVGKLHLNSAYQRVEERGEDGYSYFQYSHAPRDDWPEQHDYADWVRDKGHSLAKLNENASGIPADLHQTTWAAEKSIEFVQAKQDRPWLLSVNFYDPHAPFNPPADYRARFDPEKMPDPIFRDADLVEQAKFSALAFNSEPRHPSNLDIKSPVIPKSPERGEAYEFDPNAEKRDYWTLMAAYCAMIKLIDDQVGRIIEALEATNQLDNTIIIFTSDHGEALGDHGLIQKGCRFYDCLLRVPLIISCPGVVKSGIVSSALVELLDIPATLLDYAGIDIPAHYHGRSLVPILSGSINPDHHRDYVRAEYYNALDLPNSSWGTMYRTKQYKLVCYHDLELGELFDMHRDPLEYQNLWNEPRMQEVKCKLLKKSFDATVKHSYWGPERIGPM